MKVIFDSTVLLHLRSKSNKMKQILNDAGVTEFCITQINYLETLAGASEKDKVGTKKYLDGFPVLPLSQAAIARANKMAMKYRVSTKNQRDFLIAAIAIENDLHLVTENTKDFTYKQLKLVKYNIATY